MSRVAVGHKAMAKCVNGSFFFFGLLLPAQAASVHYGWFQFSCSLATVLKFIGYAISNQHAYLIFVANSLQKRFESGRVGKGTLGLLQRL